MAANPALQNPATSLISGRDLVPVAPDDGADLVPAARGLRCKPVSGQAGTVRITTAAGTVRNTEIGQGEFLAVEVRRVHQTGTTATGLEALI